MMVLFIVWSKHNYNPFADLGQTYIAYSLHISQQSPTIYSTVIPVLRDHPVVPKKQSLKTGGLS